MSYPFFHAGAGAFVTAAVMGLVACSSDPAGAPSEEGDAGTLQPGAPDGALATDGGGGIPGTDGGAPDATLDAAPAAPGIRFVGRVDTSDGKGTRFEWPGVSFHASFTGTSVAMDLDDSYATEFAVFVDGVAQPNVVCTKGRQIYDLATGLKDGNHELVVWRRSESTLGLSELFGLTFGDAGTLLAPPPALARRIEIIGDSISCGYGNEGQPGCDFTPETENNYLAYGSVAARAVNAEVSTVAWSGLGMYRNYDDVDASAKPLPYYYDDALATVPVAWDFTKYVPDVVVINLGTNDSSTHGDPGTPFVDAYVAFVAHVRSKYPSAWIVCIDANTYVTKDVADVVATVKSAGDTKIEAFAMTGQNGEGCNGHPNVASDAVMGQSLGTEIARVMGW